ncbi:MAG: hypothetical protein ACTSR8_00315 [Promethearchaeota archaeon]
MVLKNMNKDALKFFQSYIKTIIEIGGQNLPRSISTKLGTKLGKIYKKKGLTGGLERSLERIYAVLGVKADIERVDKEAFIITIKHKHNWCPIGGAYNPSNAGLFQYNICLPYTVGFLTEISDNKSNFHIDIEHCILSNSKNECRYCLKETPRTGSSLPKMSIKIDHNIIF